MSKKLPRSYRKWDSMKARCHRKSHPGYKYYGERGITVCARWRESYAAFLADMGEPPPGLWLERIDNARGYEPGNCRWATPKEQAANRRKRQPIPGSLRNRSKLAGLPYMRVYQRIASGWDVDKALTVPVQPRGGMLEATKRLYNLP